ncbi:MAG: ClpX C4-type zinc finger protein [Acidimicrobiales bacterium]
MHPPRPTPRPLRASCSFCGKASTAVERMVAGPGDVFICNECIALCADIVDAGAGAAAPDSPYRRGLDGERSTEEILAMLPALVDTADRIESELASWVGRLRERGTDWPTIAGVGGMEVEAARRRFPPAPAGGRDLRRRP